MSYQEVCLGEWFSPYSEPMQQGFVGEYFGGQYRHRPYQAKGFNIREIEGIGLIKWLTYTYNYVGIARTLKGPLKIDEAELLQRIEIGAEVSSYLFPSISIEVNGNMNLQQVAGDWLRVFGLLEHIPSKKTFCAKLHPFSWCNSEVRQICRQDHPCSITQGRACEIENDIQHFWLDQYEWQLLEDNPKRIQTIWKKRLGNFYNSSRWSGEILLLPNRHEVLEGELRMKFLVLRGEGMDVWPPL